MNRALVVDVVQRTPEWFAARCGRLTGTGAADMLATIRSGEAAARRDLRLRLVVERLTQRPQDEHGYVSADMQWGLDHERDARHEYEALTGEVVHEIGFLAHPDLPVGCSLDGAVAGGAGIVEIKCPRSAQHLRTLRASGVLPEYLPQVHHNLWVSGAQWCDFVSFDPRFPDALRVVVARVAMTPAERYSYELIVRRFLSEVDSELAEVQTLLQSKVGAP
jgi:predicted phage-related endonuclease